MKKGRPQVGADLRGEYGNQFVRMAGGYEVRGLLDEARIGIPGGRGNENDLLRSG